MNVNFVTFLRAADVVEDEPAVDEPVVVAEEVVA